MRGHLGVVIGQRNLQNVRTHDIRPGQPPQRTERLTAGQPADPGRPCTGSMLGIQDVDASRDVGRGVSHPLADPLGGSGSTDVSEIHGRHEAEARLPVLLRARIDSAPRPRTDRVSVVDEPFFRGAAERRPMGKGHWWPCSWRPGVTAADHNPWRITTTLADHNKRRARMVSGPAGGPANFIGARPALPRDASSRAARTD